jgi:DNA repair protein RadC
MRGKKPKSERAIRNLAEADRPREKMLNKGKEFLSDSELIAILIHSGNNDKSAVDLAREILQLGNDNLARLSQFSVADFKRVKGIGEAKAVAVVAALELGRRRQMADGLELNEVSNSKTAAAILIPLMNDLPQERFCLLCLNANNKLLHYEFVSSGGLTSTIVDPKLIFKIAIQCLASKMIIAHNHPSGNLKPSASDRAVTEKILNGTKALDLHLMDHLIIADNKYFSFADEGLLR